MSAIQAIILGIVQGLTEFIPVSSSGHLIAVPELLGWNYQGKAFDVAVHLGTLAALVIYYRREWVEILRSFFSHILKGVPYPAGDKAEVSGRMLVPIIVACIPAAVVGLLWEDIIENELSRWYFVAGALVVFGLVMLWADRLGKKQRSIAQMNYLDYILVGCAQALALFPGVSRSGITISAGLFRGLDRAAAAHFSFLMSTPIILGAGVVALKGAIDEGLRAAEMSAFGWGFISAAVSGYVAIHFLISFLRKHNVDIFVVYRILLAAALVAVFVLRK